MATAHRHKAAMWRSSGRHGAGGGNPGKQRDAFSWANAEAGHASGDCCGSAGKTRLHDTSRIAGEKLTARVGEEFALACPGCGGDIQPRGDGRQEPAHYEPEVRKRKRARMARPGANGVGELSPCEARRHGVGNRQHRQTARSRWGEVTQVHDDPNVFQASPEDLPVIDIHLL